MTKLATSVSTKTLEKILSCNRLRTYSRSYTCLVGIDLRITQSQVTECIYPLFFPKSYFISLGRDMINILDKVK